MKACLRCGAPCDGSHTVDAPDNVELHNKVYGTHYDALPFCSDQCILDSACALGVELAKRDARERGWDEPS